MNTDAEKQESQDLPPREDIRVREKSKIKGEVNIIPTQDLESKQRGVKVD
jgi:hypothetical protein